MKRFILLLFILTSIDYCKAQKSKPALFDFCYNYDFLGSSNLSGKSETVKSYFNFPLYRKDSELLVGRIQFKSRSTNGLDSQIDSRVYSTDLHLFWLRSLTAKYKLNIFSQGGIHSDFQDISSDDWRYSLGIRLIIKHTGKFKTGWGLAYNRQHFGHQITPFLSIDYKLNSKWNISGLLPIKPKITYKINAHCSWVHELSGNVGSYRLSQFSDNNDYLRVNNWRLISRLEYTFKKHHRLNVSVGYILRQRYSRYAGNNEQDWSILTIDLGNNNLPITEIRTQGWTFDVGYSFILSKEKE